MSDEALIIRRAFPEDREAVRNVLLDAYGQYEMTLPADRWSEYKANILASVDEAATTSRLVAEFGGEIVGSLFLFDSSAAAYGRDDLGIETPVIRLLGVARKARGLGVATALIKASAKECRERGADMIHLHTSDMMDSAVRLYERLGFERAYDKDLMNGDLLVKSYRLRLNETSLLEA